MVTRHDICQAAYRLFCDRGYSLAMADIAGLVGLKTPSLYSHYSGKDEIIEEMIGVEVERFYAVLDGFLDAASELKSEEALRLIFFSIIDYFGDYSRLRFWRSLPLIPNDTLREGFGRAIRQRDGASTEKIKRLFARGIDCGELRTPLPDGSIFLFTAMIQGIMDGMLLYPIGGGKPFFAEQVFEAYWAGIRADRRGA